MIDDDPGFEPSSKPLRTISAGRHELLIVRTWSGGLLHLAESVLWRVELGFGNGRDWAERRLASGEPAGSPDALADFDPAAVMAPRWLGHVACRPTVQWSAMATEEDERFLARHEASRSGYYERPESVSDALIRCQLCFAQAHHIAARCREIPPLPAELLARVAHR